MKTLKPNSISFVIRLLLACVILLLGCSVQAKITETTYSYDSNSNRFSETVTADGVQRKSLAYAYDSMNRLTGITNNIDASQNITYSYDNNGNRTSKTVASDTSNYIYNAEDQLVRVEENSNTLASFAYDHQGMRIKKEGERGTEIYTYDDQSALYQTDSNGALQAKFTYGPNQLLSITEPGEQQQYYLFDGLGSPITLTKASGEISARYSYDAFGNKIQNSGNSANRFTFTSHEKDRETDLVYMKARYYDPDTGQFLTEDNFGGFPDQPPSLNKYLYAYNNPGIYVDPDGNVAIVGAGINMGLDLAIQGVEYALSDEKEFTLDKESLLISAGSGAAGVGLISNVNKLAKLGKLAKSSKVLSKAAKNTKVQNAARGAAAFGVDASVTAADMAARGEEVTTGDVVKSTLFGMAIGKQLDKVIGGISKNKDMRVQESTSSTIQVVPSNDKAKFVFDSKAERFRDSSSGQFVSARDLPWPDNAGFSSSTKQTVEPGKILDRFGSTDGRFLGEPGATVSERGMAQGSERMPYRKFMVLKPFEARVGPAASVPEFQAEGGATQFLPGKTVDELINGEIIKEILE